MAIFTTFSRVPVTTPFRVLKVEQERRPSRVFVLQLPKVQV